MKLFSVVMVCGMLMVSGLAAAADKTQGTVRQPLVPSTVREAVSGRRTSGAQAPAEQEDTSSTSAPTDAGENSSAVQTAVELTYMNGSYTDVPYFVNAIAQGTLRFATPGLSGAVFSEGYSQVIKGSDSDYVFGTGSCFGNAINAMQTVQKRYVENNVHEYGKSAQIWILVDQLQYTSQIMPFGSKHSNRLYDQFCLLTGRRFILYKPW